MDSRDQPFWVFRHIGPSPSIPKCVEVVELKEGRVVFGRGATADVYIDSLLLRNFISRRHAIVEGSRDQDGRLRFLLHNQGLNGTYVNDVRIGEVHHLQEGDKVTFGHKNGYKVKVGETAHQPESEFQFVVERCASGRTGVQPLQEHRQPADSRTDFRTGSSRNRAAADAHHSDRSCAAPHLHGKDASPDKRRRGPHQRNPHSALPKVSSKVSPESAAPRLCTTPDGAGSDSRVRACADKGSSSPQGRESHAAKENQRTGSKSRLQDGTEKTGLCRRHSDDGVPSSFWEKSTPDSSTPLPLSYDGRCLPKKCKHSSVSSSPSHHTWHKSKSPRQSARTCSSHASLSCHSPWHKARRRSPKHNSRCRKSSLDSHGPRSTSPVQGSWAERPVSPGQASGHSGSVSPRSGNCASPQGNGGSARSSPQSCPCHRDPPRSPRPLSVGSRSSREGGRRSPSFYDEPPVLTPEYVKTPSPEGRSPSPRAFSSHGEGESGGEGDADSVFGDLPLPSSPAHAVPDLSPVTHRHRPHGSPHHSKRDSSPNGSPHHSKRDRSPNGSPYHSKRDCSPNGSPHHFKRDRSPNGSPHRSKRNHFSNGSPQGPKRDRSPNGSPHDPKWDSSLNSSSHWIKRDHSLNSSPRHPKRNSSSNSLSHWTKRDISPNSSQHCLKRGHPPDGSPYRTKRTRDSPHHPKKALSPDSSPPRPRRGSSPLHSRRDSSPGSSPLPPRRDSSPPHSRRDSSQDSSPSSEVSSTGRHSDLGLSGCPRARRNSPSSPAVRHSSRRSDRETKKKEENNPLRLSQSSTKHRPMEPDSTTTFRDKAEHDSDHDGHGKALRNKRKHCPQKGEHGEKDYPEGTSGMVCRGRDEGGGGGRGRGPAPPGGHHGTAQGKECRRQLSRPTTTGHRNVFEEFASAEGGRSGQYGRRRRHQSGDMAVCEAHPAHAPPKAARLQRSLVEKENGLTVGREPSVRQAGQDRASREKQLTGGHLLKEVTVSIERVSSSHDKRPSPSAQPPTPTDRARTCRTGKTEAGREQGDRGRPTDSMTTRHSSDGKDCKDSSDITTRHASDRRGTQGGKDSSEITSDRRGTQGGKDSSDITSDRRGTQGSKDSSDITTRHASDRRGTQGGKDSSDITTRHASDRRGTQGSKDSSDITSDRRGTQGGKDSSDITTRHTSDRRGTQGGKDSSDITTRHTSDRRGTQGGKDSSEITTRHTSDRSGTQGGKVPLDTSLFGLEMERLGRKRLQDRTRPARDRHAAHGKGAQPSADPGTNPREGRGSEDKSSGVKQDAVKAPATDEGRERRSQRIVKSRSHTPDAYWSGGETDKAKPVRKVATRRPQQNRRQGDSAGSHKVREREESRARRPARKRTRRKRKEDDDDDDDDGNESLEEGVTWYEEDTCASAHCHRPADRRVQWVCCDDCDSWYHTVCVGIFLEDLKEEEDYHCGCV